MISFATALAVLTWAAVHLGRLPCAEPEGCAAAMPAGCHADCHADYQADADPAAPKVLLSWQLLLARHWLARKVVTLMLLLLLLLLLLLHC